MKDKLYSRWRINLPNFSGLNSIKAILLILLVLIIISVIMFCRAAYPVIKATCETAASSKGNKIINEEVSKIMENYSYSDLINIDKDSNGKIFAVRPICTHLGCLLSWNDVDKTWDCPCHGSRFDYTGKNIYDPAFDDLIVYNLYSD